MVENSFRFGDRRLNLNCYCADPTSQRAGQKQLQMFNNTTISLVVLCLFLISPYLLPTLCVNPHIHHTIVAAEANNAQHKTAPQEYIICLFGRIILMNYLFSNTFFSYPRLCFAA